MTRKKSKTNLYCDFKNFEEENDLDEIVDPQDFESQDLDESDKDLCDLMENRSYSDVRDPDEYEN